MIIRNHVYDPANSLFKNNDKAACYRINCENTECPLLKQGYCTMVSTFGDRCPYGSKSCQEGYTKKARKYREWINEKKNEYPNLTNIKQAPKKLAFVGDYVYLPYAHMTMCRAVPFNKHAHLLTFGDCFLPKEHWTVDNVVTLISFTPKTFVGNDFVGNDEIKSYQKEQIPMFIEHLREEDIDMWNEVVKIMPELNKPANYVGREAYVKTLKPGIEFETEGSKGKYIVNWYWDGKKLTTTSRDAYNSTWGAIKANSVNIEVTPRDDETIKVQSNDWVISTTRFKV